MNTIDWDELEILFERVKTLPPDERARHLDAACAGKPALRLELDALLSAADDAADFFDSFHEAVFAPEETQQQTDPHNLSGSTIRHYRVLAKLGGGGMGVVYKAHDTRLRRDVALKFLPPLLTHNDEARQRFTTEAQAASALDHTNICTIYEIGQTDQGQTFIAMACYDGETLKKKIARGPLPVAEALDNAAQIARGLAKAHSRDIVHRDIKPANVMVTEDGVVKIVDFGLAKMADVHLTRTGTTMGTVAYMSPEQAHGDTVDHRTDLWSLGVVLYEMLTGERPFRGDHAEAIIYSVLNEAPKPLTDINPGVPADLTPIVARCLEKDRTLRYETMDALLADLEAWTHGSGLSKSTIRHALRRRRRLRPALVSAGVVVALAVLLAIPAVWQSVVNALGGDGPEEVALAVLPFTDRSADSSYQHYNEGLRMQLTTTLTQMKRYAETPLRVISADEMGTLTSAAEARSTFGADQVIQGRLQRQGEQVHLYLTLVDTETSEQISALTLKEPMGEATFEGEMVKVLAELLKIPLTAQQRRALTVGGTANSRAYAYYLEGRPALERMDRPENTDLAIKMFNFALDEDSTFAQARAGLGRAYVYKYEQTADTAWIQRAEQASRSALALDDRLAEAHMTLGLLFTKTGAYQDAIGEFKIAHNFDSTNADIYLQTANVYDLLGRLDEAENTYLDGIAVRPGYYRLYNKLGEFYRKNKRYEEAALQFNKVIELIPDSRRGYVNLGAVYLSQGNLAEAQRWLKRSIDVEPNFYAYNNLGNIAWYEQRYRDQARMYEQALKLAFGEQVYAVRGNLAGAYHQIPEERYKAGPAYNKAIQAAEDQLRINPSSAELAQDLSTYYNDLGALSIEDGRYQDAANAYKQSVGYRANNDAAWSGLADAYDHLPDHRQEARETRQRAIQEAETNRIEQPDDAVLLARLAGYYIGLDQPDPARSVLNHALAANPDDVDLMVEAAHLYLRLADNDAAWAVIEKALQNGYPLEQIQQDTSLAALRTDPRFQRLVPAPTP